MAQLEIVVVAGREKAWGLKAMAVASLMALTLLFGVGGSASANSCANACYAEENRCRIATKNSPSCSARLTACLQRCLKK